MPDRPRVPPSGPASPARCTFALIMATGNVILRFGRLADAPAIAMLSRELIEAGLGWSWTPARVAHSIRDPDTITLIGADGACVAAFAIMHFGDERAHLNLLAVRPTHQRKGIGSRMMDWLMESALVAGIATVSLELRASNDEARRFYLAQEFSETQNMPGYYRGRESAVRMVRTLRSADLRPAQWDWPGKPLGR